MSRYCLINSIGNRRAGDIIDSKLDKGAYEELRALGGVLVELPDPIESYAEQARLAYARGAGDSEGVAIMLAGYTATHHPLPGGTAGGDLGETYPNPKVVAIEGIPIEDGAGPSAGDALLYNAATHRWEHSPIVFGGGPPVGPAGGDLAGLYPDPSIALLAVTDDKVATANKDGLVSVPSMRTLGTGAQQACAGNDARLSNSRTPTGTAGGDLTGTYPNPTIAAGAVTDAKTASANKDGLAGVPSMRTLGTGAQQACAGNDARLSDSRAPSGAAGGDLAGTYPNPTLALVGSAGSHGSASSVPVFTTDTNGRVTASTDTAILIAESQVSGLTTDLAAKALKTTSVIAGVGLSGGGNLANNVTVYMPNIGSAGTFGSSSQVPVVTTDGQGRVTGITLAAVSTTSIQTVCGSFSDAATQPIPTAPSTLAVQYDTVELAGGVTVANNGLGKPTRLTVPISGVYSFDISPQLANSGGGSSIITFWAMVNGVNVPRSGSTLEMGNNNNRTLPFLQLDLPMTAGQYLEWFFTATGSNSTLQFFNATATIPAVPSVIANVKRIGALP